MAFLSPSSFKVYGECPKQYWYSKVMRLKRPLDTKRFIHGSLIQRVIELWYLGEKYKEGATARQWLHDNLRVVYDTDPDIIKDKVKARWDSLADEEAMLAGCHPQLDNFLNLFKEHKLGSRTHKLELNLSCDLGKGRKVSGRADFWIPKEDAVYLIDGKATAKKIGSWDQLLFYALMAFKSRGILPKIGYLYYKLGYLEMCEYTEADLLDAERRLNDTFDRIENNEFPANVGNACYFCQYKGDCAEYKEKYTPAAIKREAGDWSTREISF